MTSLARDKGGNPVQGPLSYQPSEAGAGGAFVGTVGASSIQIGPFDPSTNVISIYASFDFFLELGVDNTVVATNQSHFIPGSKLNGLYLISLGGPGGIRYSYLAAIESTAGGSLYVSERC